MVDIQCNGRQYIVCPLCVGMRCSAMVHVDCRVCKRQLFIPVSQISHYQSNVVQWMGSENLSIVRGKSVFVAFAIPLFHRRVTVAVCALDSSWTWALTCANLQFIRADGEGLDTST